MKKFLSLICMITCVLGLTACGSEVTYTEYEQTKMALAESYATQMVVPALVEFMDEGNVNALDEYTAEETAYVIYSSFGFDADGYAFKTAVTSFYSAKESMGNVIGIGEARSEIDDDQIIVRVQIDGEKKDAEAEVIFSNDMFMRMESAALNPISTMGDLMEKAALNTLIGMGTVFVVLILISFIISAFGLIPKIQAAFSGKKQPKTTGVDNAVAQIVVQEESAGENDDLELAAVIAAAVAAYEGSASTDGLVVRSIRKVTK